LPLKGKNELKSKFEEVNATVDETLLNKNFVFQGLLLAIRFRNTKNLIHCHLPRAELLVALFGSWKLRKVCTRHFGGRFLPKGSQIVSRGLSKFSERHFDKIIAISIAVKDYSVTSGEVKNTKKYVYNSYSKIVLYLKDTLAYKDLKDFKAGEMKIILDVVKERLQELTKEFKEEVKDQLNTQDVMSSGDRKQAVQNSIPAYDKGVTLPMWAAKMMGVVIEKIGPKGLEYARFSIDSHFTRNYLYVKRNYPEKLAAHVPEYAKKIVEQYKLPD
jgi:hypothetical protein